jgi:hypothetical protein
MGLFDALEDAVNSVFDAGSQAATAVYDAGSSAYAYAAGSQVGQFLGAGGQYLYNGLDNATARDGWFTQIAQRIPVVGFVPGLVQLGHGNYDHALAVAGYQMNALITTAGTSAGFMVGGPAGAVAGGAMSGAFGTYVEAEWGNAFVSDEGVRGQMASVSATDIALGGVFAGMTANLGGAGNAYMHGFKAHGGNMAGRFIRSRYVTNMLRDTALDTAWDQATGWASDNHGDVTDGFGGMGGTFADDGWDSPPGYDPWGNTINSYDPNSYTPNYMDPYYNGQGFFAPQGAAYPAQLPLDQWWAHPQPPAVWQANTIDQFHPGYYDQMHQAYPSYDPYNTRYDEYGYALDGSGDYDSSYDSTVGLVPGLDEPDDRGYDSDNYGAYDDGSDMDDDFDDGDGYDDGDDFDDGYDDAYDDGFES